MNGGAIGRICASRVWSGYTHQRKLVPFRIVGDITHDIGLVKIHLPCFTVHYLECYGRTGHEIREEVVEGKHCGKILTKVEDYNECCRVAMSYIYSLLLEECGHPVCLQQQLETFASPCPPGTGVLASQLVWGISKLTEPPRTPSL